LEERRVEEVKISVFSYRLSFKIEKVEGEGDKIY